MIRIILTLASTAFIAFASIYLSVQNTKLTKENKILKTKLNEAEDK